ncbi:MAG: transcriptional regulator [Actinomycetia bacterium]|nr:transcriptional regulator [Actinomycetes bacterium]
MGFDAYAFLLTDPETSVGAAPLADIPGLQDLPRLIRLKYLTKVNRWTSPSRPSPSWKQPTPRSSKPFPTLALCWRCYDPSPPSAGLRTGQGAELPAAG